MSMTRAESDALYAAGPDAVFAAFQQQAAQVATLSARVQTLEARLEGHRQNSHRPPRATGRASRRAVSGRAAAKPPLGSRGSPARPCC